jgi:hypothetical protein
VKLLGLLEQRAGLGPHLIFRVTHRRQPHSTSLLRS